MTGTPTMAMALPGHEVRTFKGRYLLPGDRMIEGVIARPVKIASPDVVLLLHNEDGLSDMVQRTAERYAGLGYLVVAPNLRKSFGGLGTSHETQVAAGRALAANVAGLTNARGKVFVETL